MTPRVHAGTGLAIGTRTNGFDAGLPRPSTFRDVLAGRARAGPTGGPTGLLTRGEGLLRELTRDAKAVERLVSQAVEGRSLGTSELLVVQARVYGFALRVDLASKVVEKSVGTVRRVMDLQV